MRDGPSEPVDRDKLHGPRLLATPVYTEPMGDAARKLLEEGLALPEDERLDLASALWASVPREPEPCWEAAWKAEIERRISDSHPSIPWDEVRRSVLTKLDK